MAVNRLLKERGCGDLNLMSYKCSSKHWMLFDQSSTVIFYDSIVCVTNFQYALKPSSPVNYKLIEPLIVV